MKIYNANFKVYRLDFNMEVLKENPLLNIKYEIVKQIFPSSDGTKTACKYCLRIACHSIAEKLNIEAIGYLSEYSSTLVIEDIVSDKDGVKRFVENALLNQEVYYQEHKPKYLYLDNLILNPNIDSLVNEIISTLQDGGYYPQ